MRFLIGGAIFLALTFWAIMSASHGLIAKIDDMSTRGRAGVFAGLCAISAAAYFYANGDVEYLFWLYQVPSRPPSQIEFVARAEEALRRWQDDAPAGRRKGCPDRTTELAATASGVQDWGGTLVTKYFVSSHLVIAVQVARHVKLRTGYDMAEKALLLDRGTPAFEAASALNSGDPVRISGAMVAGGQPCGFPLNDGDDFLELEFRFEDIHAG